VKLLKNYFEGKNKAKQQDSKTTYMMPSKAKKAQSQGQ